MRVLRDLSIRYKLTLLLLAVVSVVLLAVSIANVLAEVQNTRTTMAAKYSTLADIVAAQSGAALSIADVDASGAQEIVADLSAEPSIRFAALYNLDGVEVARYPLSEAQTLPPRALGAAFNSKGRLDVVKEVRASDGAVVGRIFLQAATDDLRTQIRRIVVIVAVVYVIALALALLLSFALQRLISQPILELAEITKRVSTEHDYSISAICHGHDELGALSQGFNTMLAEIRRRDEELERFNEELLRSNDELRQFAYVASHDLQEPLLSITSFCHMLEEECGSRLTPAADDYLRRIVNGADRMKSLITGLLSYARVSRGEQAPFTRVNLLDVLQDALANLQDSIDSSGAQISWGEMPVVIGERIQLTQLLQNLIGNAILYRGQQPPRIRLEAIWRGDHWEFSVQDNGIGVASEHHEQVFEMFKRLHRRHEYPGTGIGLAVCRKIVQQHGGHIWLNSRLNEGSIFRFTIQTPPTGQEDSDERVPQLAANV